MGRPLRVTVIAVTVLLLAAANFVRFVQVLNQAEFMRSLGLAGPWAAWGLTGALWTVGFGAAAIGLYRLKRPAWRWTLAAIVLYQANLWLIRLAFEESPTEALTRPADAAISILSVVIVWAVLLTPRARRVFK